MRAELSHWHPVLPSAELDRTPVAVQLLGREIVVFRTAGGRVAALEDKCPHRRMRLSKGRIEGKQIVCQYHGWRFGADGAGESPASPTLETCAVHYEAVERHGAVWIRSPGADTAFPQFDVAGFTAVPLLQCTIEAPLAVVLDNFIEVEHTGTTHELLGYDLDCMDVVETKVETTPDSVDVFNIGPQRHLPWYVRRVFGLSETDEFIDEWRSYFSPVYTVYDHWWRSADTHERRPKWLRTYVFFNPIDADTTNLVVFCYATQHWLTRVGLGGVLKWYTRSLLAREIRLDKDMIESLADKSETLKGMRLSLRCASAPPRY